MELKALFALSSLAGVLGLVFLGASSVLAGPSTFTTFRGETDSWTSEDGFCNEAFGGAGTNCAMCDGTRLALGYDSLHAECSEEAYIDCGPNPPCCLNAIEESGFNPCGDP